MLKNKKIILGVSGGIAAYKSCELVRLLKEREAEVVVIMTKSAQKFVTPLTFETLSGNEVISELFPEGKFVGTRHIDLSAWPDLIVIAPATADLIGRIKNGLADDILSTVIIGSKARVLVCPSMNTNMYENPIVQDSIKYLESKGYLFMEPDIGELACKTYGKGRLPEPQAILDEILKILDIKVDLSGVDILVTAGPTREALDPVRFISNRSSGKMGYALAEEAFKRGAKVTLVSGPSSLRPASGINFIGVRTAEEMYKAVESSFTENKVLIMAAAVSDFAPQKVASQKIKKDDKKLSLELKPTRDILREISKHKKDKILIGFSLETENEIENAKRKLSQKNLDLIVLNSPNENGAGFEVDTNKVTIIDQKGKIEKLALMTKQEVAKRILDKVKQLL